MTYNPNQARNAKGSPMAGAWTSDSARGGAESGAPSAPAVQGHVRWQFYVGGETDYPTDIGQVELDVEAVLDTYRLDEIADDDGQAFEISNSEHADDVFLRGQQLGLIPRHPMRASEHASFGFTIDQEDLQRYVERRQAQGQFDATRSDHAERMQQADAARRKANAALSRAKHRAEDAQIAYIRLLAEQDGVAIDTVRRTDMENDYWDYEALDADGNRIEIDDLTALHEELQDLVNIDIGDDQDSFIISTAE